jgi:hypothetical protein
MFPAFFDKFREGSCNRVHIAMHPRRRIFKIPTDVLARVYAFAHSFSLLVGHGLDKLPPFRIMRSHLEVSLVVEFEYRRWGMCDRIVKPLSDVFGAGEIQNVGVNNREITKSGFSLSAYPVNCAQPFIRGHDGGSLQ